MQKVSLYHLPAFLIHAVAGASTLNQQLEPLMRVSLTRKEFFPLPTACTRDDVVHRNFMAKVGLAGNIESLSMLQNATDGNSWNR